jgi:hypothetical protein
MHILQCLKPNGDLHLLRGRSLKSRIYGYIFNDVYFTFISVSSYEYMDVAFVHTTVYKQINLYAALKRFLIN